MKSRFAAKLPTIYFALSHGPSTLRAEVTIDARTGALKPTTVRACLWALLLTLCVVAIYGSVTRAGVVFDTAGTPAPPNLAPGDQRSLDYLTQAIGLEPGSPRYEQIATDLGAAARKFNSHPAVTLFHVVPGALFMLLFPFQLVSRLRNRFPNLHRWSGRGLLLVAVPFTLTGLFLAVSAPVSGPLGGAAALTFGALFVLFGFKAYAAVRRRDIVRHREWMLRFLAVALGIAVVRVLDIVLLATTTAPPQTLAGPSFWAGWAAALTVAELWIRTTRSSPNGTPLGDAPGPLSAPSPRP